MKYKYKNRIDENEKEKIAKALYNFGYMPDSVKYYLIYKKIIEYCSCNEKYSEYKCYSSIEKCFENKLTYKTIMDLVKKVVGDSECPKDTLKHIEFIVKFEFYVYYLFFSEIVFD